MNWHEYFIEMAQVCANKSKDRSTGVGVVVIGKDNEVRTTGYNGFPRGVNDDIDWRHERPQKYSYTEHAERNSIYHAARIGVPLKGCTMYMNWAPTPCEDCARAIIQAGIVKVIGPAIVFGGKGVQWTNSMQIGREMLDEAKVERIVYKEGRLVDLNEWDL